MEVVQLWAGVSFTARNGNTEELLNDAAAQAFICPKFVPCPAGSPGAALPGGTVGLSALARKNRVRLRVQRRRGLFFHLRPFLHRTGLWAGLALFVPLLLWSRGLVWSVDYGDLTAGQQAESQPSCGRKPAWNRAPVFPRIC